MRKVKKSTMINCLHNIESILWITQVLTKLIGDLEQAGVIDLQTRKKYIGELLQEFMVKGL